MTLGHIKTDRGFTLIELLVVIAIIGILSSVVLASLNTARNRGADANIKANLANIRAQAELIYDTDGDYDAVCGANSTTQNAQIASMIASVNSQGGSAVCGRPASGAATAWAAAGTLKTTNQFGASSGTDYFCVDSAGASKVIDSALGANTTTCP